MRPGARLSALVAAIGIAVGPAACTPRRSTPTAPAAPLAVTSHAHDGTIAALAGRNWVLREWRAGEPFAGRPVVTLRYAEGRVAGNAGCNRYTAEARPGARADELVLGSIATTRMMCPQPLMAVEARLLTALGRAKRWWLVASGDLAVAYANEDGSEAMLLFAEVTTRRSG